MKKNFFTFCGIIIIFLFQAQQPKVSIGYIYRQFNV